MSEDARTAFLVGFIVATAILYFSLQAYFPFTGTSTLFTRSVNFLYLWSPLWATLLLAFVFWRAWVVYTFSLAEQNTEHTLLEIRLPQEVMKTPLAAELMLTSMWFTQGETTIIDRYWIGKRRPWFSLEIASINGDVRFYIWTRSFYKNAIEAAIYSQYPNVEVHEVEDYTLPTSFDPSKNIMWGCEFDLTKADPYPIKTYVDYGLDSTVTKEEQKTDPITSLLEYLGSCHQGGQIWLQFIIQAHKHEKPKKGKWFAKVTWQEEAEELVHKLLKRDPKTLGPGQLSPSGFPILPTLTDEERKTVASIQRSINKQAFNVGIRGIYIAERESFNAINVIGLLGCMRQFSSIELNGFKPNRWHAIFDWPWQDYNFMRSNYFSRKLLELYKRRAYFHPPYKEKGAILTTEELATIFHLPGGVVTTPSVGRLVSKKAEPPTNLPV